MKWKISKSHKKLLDALLKDIDGGGFKSVVDMGSGRTSLTYLTDKFKKAKVKAVVYPGDHRKIGPILECVKSKNYEIIESDIRDLKLREKVDLVLAHLFLGEAEKFAENSFDNIIERLFEIKTKYLVIVDILSDKNVNYRSLLKLIVQKGKILNLNYITNKEGADYIGFLIKKK